MQADVRVILRCTSLEALLRHPAFSMRGHASLHLQFNAAKLSRDMRWLHHSAARSQGESQILSRNLRMLRSALARGSSYTQSEFVQLLASCLDETIQVGELDSTVQLLEQVADAELTTGVELTADNVHRVLVAAALQRNLPLSDRLIGLVLKAPERRLDARIVSSYVSMLASMNQPDHARGIAFTSITEHHLPGSLPAYAQAVVGQKGAGAIRPLLEYMQTNNCTPLEYAGLLRGIARSDSIPAVELANAWAAAVTSVRALQVGGAAQGEMMEAAGTLVDAYSVCLIAAGQTTEAVKLVLSPQPLPRVILPVPVSPAVGTIAAAVDKLLTSLIPDMKLYKSAPLVDKSTGDRLNALQALLQSDRLDRILSARRIDALAAVLARWHKWDELHHLVVSTIEKELTARKDRQTSYLKQINERSLEQKASAQLTTEHVSIDGITTDATTPQSTVDESDEALLEQLHNGDGGPEIAWVAAARPTVGIPGELVTGFPTIGRLPGLIARVTAHRAMVDLAGLKPGGELRTKEVESIFEAMSSVTAESEKGMEVRWSLRPTHVTFSILLRHYALSENVEKTKAMLKHMRQEGMTAEPSAVAAVSFLRKTLAVRASTELPEGLGDPGTESMVDQKGQVQGTERDGQVGSREWPGKMEQRASEATLERLALLDDHVRTIVGPQLKRMDRPESGRNWAGRKESTWSPIHIEQEKVRAMKGVNKAVQEYFSLQRPDKALHLVSLCHAADPRLIARMDTFRVVITGLFLAGGKDVAGWPASCVSREWGGTAQKGQKKGDMSSLSEAFGTPFYLGSDQGAKEKRAKDSAVQARNATEKEFEVTADPSRAVRMNKLWHLLRGLRAAELHAQASSGGKAESGMGNTDGHVPSVFVADSAVILGLQSLLPTASSAVNLISMLRAFRLRVSGQKVNPGPYSSLKGHLENEPDQLPLAQFVAASILGEAAGDSADNVETRTQLATASNHLVHQSLSQVPLARSLQLFLTLYAAGAFQARMTESPYTRVLLPDTLVIDVRAVLPDIAALLVASVLHSLAAAKLQGGAHPAMMAAGGKPKSILFVTGGRRTWVSRRVMYFLENESGGEFGWDKPLLLAKKGVFLPSTALEGWLAKDGELVRKPAQA